MSLYKVTLKNKHIVTIYEGSGKKQTSRTVEREMEQVIGGLPLVTAQAYLKVSPGALIEMEIFDRPYAGKQGLRVTDAGQKRRDPLPGTKAKKAPAPAPAPAPSGAIPAADYGTLVNKLVADAA